MIKAHDIYVVKIGKPLRQIVQIWHTPVLQLIFWKSHNDNAPPDLSAIVSYSVPPPEPEV